MKRRHLLPFFGTAIVAVGVAIASWPEARAASPEREARPADPYAAVVLVDPQEGAGVRRGLYSAEVMGVDLSRGRALVAVNGSERLLRGTPIQLEGLAPGDAVELHFRTYGDEEWLWPPERRSGAAARFTTWGVLTGPVEGLDPFRGVVRVGGQELYAHPDVVRHLAPGERVTLRFARVGAALWALSLDERGPETATAPRAGS